MEVGGFAHPPNLPAQESLGTGGIPPPPIWGVHQQAVTYLETEVPRGNCSQVRATQKVLWGKLPPPPFSVSHVVFTTAPGGH